MRNREWLVWLLVWGLLIAACWRPLGAQFRTPGYYVQEITPGGRPAILKASESVSGFACDMGRCWLLIGEGH